MAWNNNSQGSQCQPRGCDTPLGGTKYVYCFGVKCSSAGDHGSCRVRTPPLHTKFFSASLAILIP
jgi:hypothetical protein